MTMTISPQLRDELQNIEAALNKAKDERAEAARERGAAMKAYAGTDGDRTSPEFKSAQATTAILGAIDDKIVNLRERQVGALKTISGTGSGDTGSGDFQPTTAPGDSVTHWDTKDVLGDSVVQEKIGQMATSSYAIGRIELGRLASKDALAGSLGRMATKADVVGTSDMRRGDFYGVIPQLRRQLRVLDIIPSGIANGNLVPYSRETGTFTAGETTEGALKPEGGLTYLDVDALVQTIATWQKIRKQVLSDVPALATWIENRLRYAVEKRLEDQVLAGNGITPNLQGILGTTGIGTVAGVAGTPFGEQILSGLTQVRLAEADPSAIVLSPTDWQRILTTKASGSGEYLNEIEPVAGPGIGMVGGAGTMAPTLWGVPVIVSTVIAAGTALVGDFAIGSQLWIRDGVNVLLSDADQDDFIRNKITVLAELRAAFGVIQPAAFSTVALA